LTTLVSLLLFGGGVVTLAYAKTTTGLWIGVGLMVLAIGHILAHFPRPTS
jgi:hypothetical protein